MVISSVVASKHAQIFVCAKNDFVLLESNAKLHVMHVILWNPYWWKMSLLCPNLAD